MLTPEQQNAKRSHWLKRFSRVSSPRMDSTVQWEIRLALTALPRARSLNEALDMAMAADTRQQEEAPW